MTLDIFAINSPEWMEDPNRNCAIAPDSTPEDARNRADLWFPTENNEARYAKRLCHGCPAERQCFMYAFERPELEGIWGATTTGQRMKLRAEVRKAATDAA